MGWPVSFENTDWGVDQYIYTLMFDKVYPEDVLPRDQWDWQPPLGGAGEWVYHFSDEVEYNFYFSKMTPTLPIPINGYLRATWWDPFDYAYPSCKKGWIELFVNATPVKSPSLYRTPCTGSDITSAKGDMALGVVQATQITQSWLGVSNPLLSVRTETVMESVSGSVAILGIRRKSTGNEIISITTGEDAQSMDVGSSTLKQYNFTETVQALLDYGRKCGAYICYPNISGVGVTAGRDFGVSWATFMKDLFLLYYSNTFTVEQANQGNPITDLTGTLTGWDIQWSAPIVLPTLYLQSSVMTIPGNQRVMYSPPPHGWRTGGFDV